MDALTRMEEMLKKKLQKIRSSLSLSKKLKIYPNSLVLHVQVTNTESQVNQDLVDMVNTKTLHYISQLYIVSKDINVNKGHYLVYL